MPNTPTSAIAAATDAVRHYLASPDDQKTGALRTAAEALVNLRSLYLDDDGSPDWGGKTWPYRKTVTEIYDDAGVSAAQRERVRSAIGYHVSALLRERLNEEQLAEIGLRPISARGRSAEKREKQSAMLSVLRGGPVMTTTEEVLQALTAGRALLARIPSAAVVDASAADRSEVREALAEVEEEVTRLVGAAVGESVRRKG